MYPEKLLLACTLFMIGTLTAFGQDQKLRQIPATADRIAAEGILRDVLGADLAKAKTAPQKAQLSKKLLQMGIDSKNDPAGYYVLLREALTQAVGGSDLDTALAALQELDQSFADVPLQTVVDTLQKLGQVTKDAGQLKTLAIKAQKYSERAAANGDFAAGRDLAQTGKVAATGAKDFALVRKLSLTIEELNKADANAAELSAALATLENLPKDPTANLKVGRHYCLILKNWQKGLPYLARGSDEGLAKVATLELENNETANQYLALGDAWWDLAEENNQSQQAIFRSRAAEWYRQAQPQLQGLAKLRIDRRLADMPIVEDPAPAARSPIKLLTNSLGMKFVYIPSGEFVMGSPETESERDPQETQHKVTLSRNFYCGVHEVTVGQFRKFVTAAGYRTEAERSGQGRSFNLANGLFERALNATWRNTGFIQLDSHPVVVVSWNDAVAFCEWLSQKEGKTYRLPTEAEWEYCCRAGTQSAYQSGNDPEEVVKFGNVLDATAQRKLNKTGAVSSDDRFVFTAPIGTFRANSWGLFDMHGNVWEWCSDHRREYSTTPIANPIGSTSDDAKRIIRGGSWHSHRSQCRSAARSSFNQDWRIAHVGFRVVLVHFP